MSQPEGPPQQPEPSWWDQRSALEKVGVVALSVVGIAVTATVLFPEFVAVAAGGALTASGALLLKMGFKGPPTSS